MDLSTLRQRFALPDVLSFDDENGLTRLHIHTHQATATLYLQGAHLTAWTPSGYRGVIFVSRRAEYAPGKPIRGGIPVVFPWFANDQKRDRIDGHPGPAHGFARVQEWTLTKAEHLGENVHLALELGPTAMSRSMGFDRFKLTLEFRIGPTLAMSLSVLNLDDKPLQFEEALHTYYSVTDSHEVTLNGLEAVPYIDKTDAFKVKPATHQPVTFAHNEDRVYANTTGACTIHDHAGTRRILVRKTNSNTTVVWTPWDTMAELDTWEWHEMLAVETANAGANSVTLPPGQQHTMTCNVSVEREPG
jgi:glucose-6-phosphate 1-epimerase